MRNYSILIVFLLGANSLRADVCSDYNCPQGRQPTTICFSDPELNSGHWKIDAAANCGYFTDIINVTSNEQIKSALTNLAKNCKSLTRMNFQGHGSDGYQGTGELDSGSVQDFSSFGCLFERDAKIEFYGCSVGQGCSGDMLLYQTAKSFLKNGGSVRAPTSYSSSFLPGIIPSFSLNGRSRMVTFNPALRPPDNWTLKGLAISNGGSINDRCANDLKDLLGYLERAKTSAQKRQCSSTNDYVSGQRLTGYRQTQRRLLQPPPYLQSANSDAWYELSNAISSMKYQIRRYETCQPPSKGSDGSGTISEGVK
ncbi:MAG: hypothetical protein A4S09_06235 [Proteobacteria bacterium SG_bin7]|nr:MAG: hypothetical protein A4S09_06235 [Proteobacteria bacterium SG_bin7]